MAVADIRVLPHHALPAALARQLLDVCSDAYEEDFAPFFSLLGDATHLLLMDGDTILSHAAWVPRVLRYGDDGTPLTCAYVEAVATPVRLQRRGHGTQVLRAIPPLITGFDIAALSPSEPAFYARSGWEMWEGPLCHVEDGVRHASHDEEAMILRLPGTPATLDVRERLEADWREGDIW